MKNALLYGITCFSSVELTYTSLPSLSTIRVTRTGSICLPSFAIVQYALTISNRLTSEAPNANEGSSSKGLFIPMSCAVLAMFFIPISCPSLTAIELILFANALFKGMESPENLPLAFVGVHEVISCLFLSYTCILMYSSLLLSQGVSPWFIASVYTNSLNVEPGWRIAVTLSYFHELKSMSPTHALTAPVCGSIATNEQCMNLTIYLMESIVLISFSMVPFS